MSLVIACVLSLLPFADPGSAEVPGDDSHAFVEPAVHAEFTHSADGRAFVIAILDPVTPGARGQLAQQQQRVAEVQQRVLDGLLPGDLQVGHRLANVAVLTGRTTPAGLARLAAHPDVLRVGVDGRSTTFTGSSVPFIGAEAMHTLGVTGVGQTVAVLDTGIDTDHPDLIDNVAAGAWHILDEGLTVGPGAEDALGHGSHVSGTITAAGVNVSKGVAPDADILAVKIISDSGTGFMSDIVAGIDYVVTQSMTVDICAINMSVGTFDLFADCPADTATTYNVALEAAMAAAKAAGIVSFCASGNLGSCGSMISPAALTSGVAVAAVYEADIGPEPDTETYLEELGGAIADCQDLTTGADVVTCFSNQSGCNELAAPGREIISTTPGLSGDMYTGTSMATPHCTAVAALLAQVTDLAPDAVVTLLKDTGASTTDGCGSGPQPIRVDAEAALTSVAWFDVGFATPGLTGPPTLTGSGLLTGSSPNVVSLSKAKSSATAGLFLALTSQPVPFKGGLLVPFPFFDPVILTTSQTGEIVLPFVMPQGIPPGTELWVQWAIQDAAAVQGVALSNGLRGTTP